ncbi:hypothetical protein [Neisseria sicca]|uniref:hypothetical protein n=1 Tax=Neisseria sicca TaxID=490 RepID=UPI001A4DD9A5|nr:hypothetical protein [Neisseria sicca]VTX54773.1 Uncharacterised protein [Neisseria sicca]
MSMRTDTPADDADAVIAEVFRLTGTRLTRDDPVMAVLLMQRQMFQTAFAGFAEHQAEQRQEFLNRLAAHERKITAAAAQLESYREQILADFVRQADRHKATASRFWPILCGRPTVISKRLSRKFTPRPRAAWRRTSTKPTHGWKAV